jgi:hypothetical protein
MHGSQETDRVNSGRENTPRSALEKLVRGKRPDQWRAEYAGAYDWGPDVGREVIEE